MHQGSTHQEQLSIPTWETLHSWLRERMQELVQWADGVYVRAGLERCWWWSWADADGRKVVVSVEPGAAGSPAGDRGRAPGDLGGGAEPLSRRRTSSGAGRGPHEVKQDFVGYP
jgi:hypothetical protein